MSKSADIYLRSPVWLQKAIVLGYGYKLYSKRYTGCFRNILAEVEASHSWSEKQARDFQNEQLHQIIKHSFATVPYYKKIAAEYSLSPSQFTSFSDLKKLPVLDKHALRASPNDFVSDQAGKPYAVTHTSGSTGTPLYVHNDEYTYKLAMALLVDFEQRNGVGFGERRASFAGRMIQRTDDRTPPFWRFNKAENQLLFSVYHLNDATFEAYADKLDAFIPKELIGHPSALANLADHYQRFNRAPTFKPSLIVTNSENLLDWQRDKIENTFSCNVKDYYCTAEYAIFAGQGNDGIYETSPLLGMAEFQPIEGDGETYNLLATSLTNRTMPLLRYSIGDTAIPADQAQLLTGAPRISAIEGRIDDYLETKDGRKIGRVSQALKGVPGVKEAQFVQSQPGIATINVVCADNSRANEKQLIQQAKHWLGSDFEVLVQFLDSIPRGRNGKFKFVVRGHIQGEKAREER